MAIKKKRFGLSSSLSQGLSEAVNIAEAAPGVFHNALLPLSRIELDPYNPRRLAISQEDILQGINENDPKKDSKLLELESLTELSHTIKNNGILNPIIVYKNNDKFRVVAGERRCLATMLAGISEIDARVYYEKPKGFELKLIQWVENTAREDLCLTDRINNIREIISEYELETTIKVNATKLKEFTGLSLSQCSNYINVLEADSEILELIENGVLLHLDKAVVLVNIKDSSLRKEAIAACYEGLNLKGLRELVSGKKIRPSLDDKPLRTIKKRGPQLTRINLGSTKKVDTIKKLVNVILESTEYSKFKSKFSNINWSDFGQASLAFKEILNILDN